MCLPEDSIQEHCLHKNGILRHCILNNLRPKSMKRKLDVLTWFSVYQETANQNIRFYFHILKASSKMIDRLPRTLRNNDK